MIFIYSCARLLSIVEAEELSLFIIFLLHELFVIFVIIHSQQDRRSDELLLEQVPIYCIEERMLLHLGKSDSLTWLLMEHAL